MNTENIRADIELLRKITDSWNGAVPEIERDIAITLLGRLYTEIKYSAAAAPEQPCTCPAAAPDAEPQQAHVSKDEAPAEAETPSPEIETTEPEPQENPQPAMQQEQTAQQSEAAVPQPETTTAEPVVQPETEAAHTDEPQPEYTIKRPVDRSVIRSLYGETTISAPKQPDTPLQEEEKKEEKPAAVQAQPVVGVQQTKVLGDVISQGPTLGDALQGSAGRDMAEKIASADTTSIRGAIGLNDRFLMIRDLFGGDAAAFDTAISALEEFTSLDDALLYINDNYDWNPQSRGAQMLVELLVRKLS